MCAFVVSHIIEAFIHHRQVTEVCSPRQCFLVVQGDSHRYKRTDPLKSIKLRDCINYRSKFRQFIIFFLTYLNEFQYFLAYDQNNGLQVTNPHNLHLPPHWREGQMILCAEQIKITFSCIFTMESKEEKVFFFVICGDERKMWMFTCPACSALRAQQIIFSSMQKLTGRASHFYI